MRKLNLLLTLVALSLATSSLWATPSVAVNGKLPGAFTINSNCDMVYFSQGNLQYNSNNQTWQFASEQYSFVGNTAGNTNITVDGKADGTGIADLFGWVGSSSNWTGLKQYGISSSTQELSGYGSSREDVLKSDWGKLAISNGGNAANSGWRTLTISEWAYLIEVRPASTVNGTANARYARANLFGTVGVILFPDNYKHPTGVTQPTGINQADCDDSSSWDANTYSADDWEKMENAGCVFLPAAGYRSGTNVYSSSGEYWSSTPYAPSLNNPKFARLFYFNALRLSTTNLETRRFYGCSVRLVKQVPTVEKKASVTATPQANTLTYSGSAQALVTAGTAQNGTMMYKLLSTPPGSYSASIPTATNAGSYTVQYYADGTGCFNNSDEVSVEVTIAKAPFAPTDVKTVEANTSLKYNGSDQELVSVSGDLDDGCSMQYSLDGINWSTDIPTASDVDDYTVYYKVVPDDSNYEDYIPDPNTINVSIAKGDYTPTGDYSVDANSLTYDGSAQPLVSLTGSVEDGTVWYKLEPSGEWSTDIPTATNAGDYSVSYKVVPTDPNYDEYIPTDSPIVVTIAKANPSATLPESTISIPYDGAEHTLLEIDPVADCVIWYKLGDGDWTTTPPTRTDAGDYSVQYKIVPDDEVNYNTIGPNTVTVTILDYPTVYDNADPSATLTSLLNTPSDLKVKRTIYADDEYNTICLPFALDESALAASPLAGFNRLKTFKGAQVTGTAPNLYIDIFVEDATTIEAGVPYLITYPSAHADIVDPVFNGITVTTTEPSAVSVDGITFQGMFAQVHIDPYTSSARDEDYLFLGANSQLYWPSSDQTSSSIKMRGFRAFFKIDRTSISPALAPKGTRARIVDAPKTTTAIDNASAKLGGSEKIIENGILYIIRNGVKYNAQGQIVK